MQISLYLLCVLQFGEIKSANKVIFTVLYPNSTHKKKYAPVIAGISQAVWDIAGKAKGKPIFSLLNN